MKDKLKGIRSYIDRKRGEESQIKKQVKNAKSDLITIRKSIRYHEEAREILKDVGLKTQQQLQFHISDITTLALEAVFPEPYELKVNFVERRNTTECDLLFVRDDHEVSPLDASGYGPVDVAAFALRVASWVMQTPRSINTIILDEPFRFLSKNYHEAASKMIKELSDRLGIQFIIVTHESALEQYADKVHKVSIKNGKSKVE